MCEDDRKLIEHHIRWSTTCCSCSEPFEDHIYLDEHVQSTHQKAKGAKAIVDAILYLIGWVEGDVSWVEVQEAAPAKSSIVISR